MCCFFPRTFCCLVYICYSHDNLYIIITEYICLRQFFCHFHCALSIRECIHVPSAFNLHFTTLFIQFSSLSLYIIKLYMCVCVSVGATKHANFSIAWKMNYVERTDRSFTNISNEFYFYQLKLLEEREREIEQETDKNCKYRWAVLRIFNGDENVIKQNTNKDNTTEEDKNTWNTLIMFSWNHSWLNETILIILDNTPCENWLPLRKSMKSIKSATTTLFYFICMFSLFC